ncbi:hypothetical protein EC844_1241 [Acinetobacter calcoaceticus]|uniref:Uncharacterized protein n=1 Tax=Acinetobacter calcoaceticus TaxID=471 RepID=A0A4R1XFW7_ACICA|nr:hypothetical protein EC844_1241 [Acinetobacter calcoaceticus]
MSKYTLIFFIALTCLYSVLSYADFRQTDQSKNISGVIKTDDIKIQSSDYKRLGLKPLYSSSTVFYDPKNKRYFEYKLFNQNVVSSILKLNMRKCIFYFRHQYATHC